MESRWNSKATDMRSPYTLVTLVILLLARTSAQSIARPPYFQPGTLDVRVATQQAENIVLAFPVDRKELNRFAVVQEDRDTLHLIETETALEVLQVFKGPPLPQRIGFRHYRKDLEHDVLIGPPQGPSGKLGKRGIFFLRRDSAGLLRSFVDIYRPDIPTPWIGSAMDVPACQVMPDCIPRFLLTFGPSYDHRMFLANLRLNLRVSWLLVGYLKTFDYVNQLAETKEDDIKLGACSELSAVYHVLPPSCRALASSAPILEQNHVQGLARFRMAVRQGGMPYMLSLLQTKDESNVIPYVNILRKSGDSETADLIERLLTSRR